MPRWQFSNRISSLGTVVVCVISVLLTSCTSTSSQTVVDQPACNQLLADAWNNRDERNHHFPGVMRGQFEHFKCLKQKGVVPRGCAMPFFYFDYMKREPVCHARILQYYDLENQDLYGYALHDNSLRSGVLDRIVSTEFNEAVSERERQYFVANIAQRIDDAIRREMIALDKHKDPNPDNRPAWRFNSTLSRAHWSQLRRRNSHKPAEKTSMFCRIVDSLTEKEALAELSAYDKWEVADDWKDCL